MNIKYNIPLKQDTIIVIAYFNSCNYQKPKQNLLEIINQLVSSQHPVCVIEAIMPNADELVLPKEVIHKKLYASKLNIMFLKENLYNIAGHTLNYTKFIFMDGDIIFDKIDWFDSCSRLLDTYDIIQPFERCYWMDKDKKSLMVSLNMNNPILTRESVGKCLYNQNPADPVKYHPGFVWAMTKNYFNKINGFYEEHIIGGGDLSLWYALDTYLDDKEKKLIKIWQKDSSIFFITDKFKEYEKLISQNKPKIGYLPDCTIYHLYHGQRHNRKYITRYNYIPLSDEHSHYPLTKNKDGLLQWINLEHAELCYEYFLGRKEDE